MRSNDGLRALCVSMHDVSPHTWPLCDRLLRAVAAVAEIPVTLLVVPAYHRLPVSDDRRYRRAIERHLTQCDELALHGFSHRDEGPAARGWLERYKRQIYTVSEGEFAALDKEAASQRIEQGLAWFRERDWPVRGFVAPAWLLSEGAWQAVAEAGFLYTTTMRRFYRLPERQALASRSLVYWARNRSGRIASRAWNRWLLQSLAAAPLVRLSLHPADARHPELIADCQRLVAQLASVREPMTKAEFARRWRPAGSVPRPEDAAVNAAMR